MAFGVSFLPGGDGSGNQARPQTDPVQQAIQMLSLRLPRVVGAQGMSPAPLLQSPGGGGLAEFLQHLFGQGHFGGPMAPGMGPMGPGASPMGPGAAPPTPRVIPGGGDQGGLLGPVGPSGPEPGAPTPDASRSGPPDSGGPTQPGPYQPSVSNPWATFRPPQGPGRFFA